MTVLNKTRGPDPAPALFRLLAESALSRAALGACGFPLALLDACASERPLSHCNAAFEGYFGYFQHEALGRSLAALLFRGDESLMHRLFAQPASRWPLRAWAKDGSVRHVEMTLGAVRSADGRMTHWVAGFSDRTEAERLRFELESVRSLAAAAAT